ncbi:unnamed protein product [Caenorhabditis auriculariae]|uniref:H15 domain-containing protein n=1 Tax=Caenorhabditis auriculariae TaxID=2777116 RepID=A0A8S1H8H8_9PELO|nr:unnamed protein product [Caenorhabditis auriculariae]
MTTAMGLSVHQNLLKLVNSMDASTDISVNYVLLDEHRRDTPPRHPTYLEMIKTAIETLNRNSNKRGISKADILKYIAQNYQLGESMPEVNGLVRDVLNESLETGEIVQIRRNASWCQAPLFCTSEIENRRKVRIPETEADMERKKSLQLQIPIEIPLLKKIVNEEVTTAKRNIGTKKTQKKTGPKKRPAITKKRSQPTKKAPNAKRAKKSSTKVPPPTKMILRSTFRS